MTGGVGEGDPEGELRVVITYDFMDTWAGAERVTREMARAFPRAPVVAIMALPWAARRMEVEHRLQTLLRPRARLARHYRLLAPAFPWLVDRTPVEETDVVLSSSYAFAHRLRSRNDAPRVCFCHSPLRFAWSMTDDYRDEWAGGRLSARAFELLAAHMRRSDRRSSRGVDRYLTSSPFTAEQIRRFYGREADVIGAPVDCGQFRPSHRPPEDYFLFSGRLVEPYKRISMVVEAFRRLRSRLVVAGDGPEAARLRRIAPPNVEFVGELRDDDLVETMQRCAAAIFPSRDDFGLVPAEVMACGRPVIAYGEGGASHTVVPGLTGEHFRPQSEDALVAAVERFRPEDYDSGRIREHALQWDAARFRSRLLEAVTETAEARVG